MSRYKGVSAEETKKKIISAVNRGFRKNGYDGVGVDALSKQADATTGAFYAHMGSKQKAFEKAVEYGLEELLIAIKDMKKQHGKLWLNNFIDFYLGDEHIADRECGCVLVSLTGDVSRHPGLYELYGNKLLEIAQLVADGFKDDRSSKTDNISKAYGLLALLSGGVNLLRAAGNDAKILTALKKQTKEYVFGA